MAWLSRARKTSGAEGQDAPPPPQVPSPFGGGAGSVPVGRYGPLVAITSFDEAPIELTWQTPMNGELYRLMPGPDRPDYSVMVLERPIHFYPSERFDVGRVPAPRQVPDRKGRPMVRVDALVVCARFVGQQLHAGMRDLAVNIAYVIDDSLLGDPSLDLAKIEYAAIGFLTEGRLDPAVPPAPAPAPEPVQVARPEQAPMPERAVEAQHGPTPDRTMADPVFGAAAQVLREGIEAQRGSRVEHLRATLTLDEEYRVVGLTGNADGTAPVPTHETFDRINTVLAPLWAEPVGAVARVETLTVTVAGEELSWETGPRN